MILAESFEQIHHSNLIGMGILPLECQIGVTHKTLRLTGDEYINVAKSAQLQPGCTVQVTLILADGKQKTLETSCRIDTATELNYYQNDEIVHYVIRNMLN